MTRGAELLKVKAIGRTLAAYSLFLGIGAFLSSAVLEMIGYQLLHAMVIGVLFIPTAVVIVVWGHYGNPNRFSKEALALLLGYIATTFILYLVR